MTLFLFLLSLTNFLCLVYLTYIVYKKNSQKNKAPNLNLPSSNIKINLVRFNPFDEMGGDQSFILCLLDSSDSGVILTSLHSRDITRVYAKTIRNGEGVDTALSKEEKLAIVKTIKC